MRSDRVVFPWSMCAMMQKLRMSLGSMDPRSEVEAWVGVHEKIGCLPPRELPPADLGDHGGVVGGELGADREALDPGLLGLLGDPGAQKGIAGDPSRKANR